MTVERPVKNKAIFYDVQEPTTDDINFINESAIDQISVRQQDMLTDGIIPGPNTFNVTATIIGSNLSINVGFGIAYLKGQRIEISQENSYTFLDKNDSWDRRDQDGVPIPRSTGNIGINTPKPSSNQRLGIFITYLSEVPFDPITGNPIDFCIDYVTYKRNYTRRRDGYIIAYTIYSSNTPVEPSEPSGVSWLHLAEITMHGNTPVINQSVKKFTKLTSGLEPAPEVSLHQFTHHSDGISNSIRENYSIIEYKWLEYRGLATVNIYTQAHSRTINFFYEISVLGIKVPIFNSSGVAIPKTNLAMSINDQPASCIFPEENIPPGYSYVTFQLPNELNTTAITIVLSSTNQNLLAIESKSASGQPAYNIYGYKSVLLWNSYKISTNVAALNDMIYLVLPNPETNPFVVNGHRISKYSYLGSPISHGVVNLQLYTSQIPEPLNPQEIIYYVLIDQNGEITIEENPNQNKLTLGKLYGKVETTWASTGGLVFSITDMDISSVNSNITELRNNLSIFPKYSISGTSETTLKILLSNHSDKYNTPNKPLQIQLSPHWAGTNVKFLTHNSIVLGEILQSPPSFQIYNLVTQNHYSYTSEIAHLKYSRGTPGENSLLCFDNEGYVIGKTFAEKQIMRNIDAQFGYIPYCISGTDNIYTSSRIYIDPNTNFVGINGSQISPPQAMLHIQQGSILLDAGNEIQFGRSSSPYGRIGYNLNAFLDQRLTDSALDIVLPINPNHGLRIGGEGGYPVYEIIKKSNPDFDYLHVTRGPFIHELSGTWADKVETIANITSNNEYMLMNLECRTSQSNTNNIGVGLEFCVRGFNAPISNRLSSIMAFHRTGVYGNTEYALGFTIGAGTVPSLKNLLILTNRGDAQNPGVDIGLNNYNRSSVDRMGRLHVYRPSPYEYGIVSEGGTDQTKVFSAQKSTTDYFVIYANGECEFPDPNTSLPPAPTGTDIVLVPSGSSYYLRRKSSSIKYKTDIQELHINSELIYSLNPKSFKFKNNPNNNLYFGLIAEEVAECIPELVNFDHAGQPESLDYSRLSVLLLAEIKKLRDRINALEKQ